MIRPFRKRSKSPWSAQRRLKGIMILAGLAVLGVSGRFFDLHVLQHRRYEAFLTSKNINQENALQGRGKIFFEDKDGKVLAAAITKKTPFLYAISKEVPDPEAYAEVLQNILHVPADELQVKLGKPDDPYELLKKKLTDEETAQVNDLALEGVVVGQEERRYYPLAETAAHVLGFVSYGDTPKGQYGIEQSLNDLLSGTTKEAPLASNFFATVFGAKRNETQVVVTIDPKVQAYLEEKMKTIQEEKRAELSFFVAMEPRTGRLLAMGASPAFDPNNYSNVADLSVFVNPNISSLFEMGSVMKAITMASALDQGVITPDTTYYDYGKVHIRDRTIENFDKKERGIQTMTQVLEQSLNTGAVFAMQQLGKENFYEYVKKFGLGEKTGIELPGEVGGNIESISLLQREVEFATASFGQGIAVTPLEFTRALGVLANDGKLMKPFVISRIIEDGKVTQETQPQEVRQVIKPETAETISRMLVDVVDKTLAKGKVHIPGYSIAAKTGTAELALPGGKGYTKDQFVHTFFGYFPAFNPRVVVFLGLVKPQGVRFASESLSPTFIDISHFLIDYYAIPPDAIPPQ